jgi:hypothetical protein
MQYIGANLQLVRENKKRDEYFAPETVSRIRNLMHIKDSSTSEFPFKKSLESMYDMLNLGYTTSPSKKPVQRLPPVAPVPISTVLPSKRKQAGSDADYTPGGKRARVITFQTKPRILDKVISSLCSQDDKISPGNVSRLPDRMATQVSRPTTGLGAAQRRIWKVRPIVPLAPLYIPHYVFPTALLEECVDEDVNILGGLHEDVELDDEESFGQEFAPSKEN